MNIPNPMDEKKFIPYPFIKQNTKGYNLERQNNNLQNNNFSYFSLNELRKSDEFKRFSRIFGRNHNIIPSQIQKKIRNTENIIIFNISFLLFWFLAKRKVLIEKPFNLSRNLKTFLPICILSGIIIQKCLNYNLFQISIGYSMLFSGLNNDEIKMKIDYLEQNLKESIKIKF